jgi:hypothetical protein
MLRFRQGPWQVALENPRSTITPNGGGARVNRDDSHRPDLVVRYDHEGQRGDVTLAAIVRQLSHVDAQSGFDDRTTAVGISVSGKIPVGDTDDFRWMISSGRGLGHYIGLNTANGAVHDAQGRLEPIASTGLFGSFRHFWSGRLRSNFTLGYFAVNNPLELTGDDVSRRAASLHSNLIFQPRPGLDMGVEWLMASRELENGLDGKLQRLQFSVKLMY